MSEMRFNWSITAIPVDPNFVPSDAALEAARAAYGEMSLCTAFRPALAVVVERPVAPRFYGSEGFSYSATCPTCGLVVDRTGEERGTAGRLWFAQVDELAAQGVDGDASVTMPGCGHDAALGAIEFEHPTGAARCALVVELPVWVGGWLEDDESDAMAALAELSETMGTPVRLVRRLYTLHPKDRRAIARLVSTDESGRLDALEALRETIEEDDPEAWPISNQFIEDNEAALLAVLATDARPLVRYEVLHLLAWGNCFGEPVRDAVANELRRPGELTGRYLMLATRAPLGMRALLLPLIRSLATDSSRSIRSDCARVLQSYHAHGPEDRAIQRALASESMTEPPVYAVLAMQDWIKASGRPIEDIDRRVLEQVVARFPSSVAASTARRLLD